MKDKKKRGIDIIAYAFFLMAIFIFKIMLQHKILFESSQFISLLVAVIFYVILGIGLLKRNNKIRLLIVIFAFWAGLAGILGFIIGVCLVDINNYLKLISSGKILNLIYAGLLISMISFLCFYCRYYLKLPEVRKEFSKEEGAKRKTKR